MLKNPSENSSGSEMLNPKYTPQKIAGNTISIILGRGFGLLLSAAGSILLARYLGHDLLGKYSLVYAYLTFFMWVPPFGMESILVREAARDRQQADRVFSLGMSTSGILALVIFPFTWVGATILGYPNDIRTLVLIGAVETILLMPLRMTGYIFQVDLILWRGILLDIGRQFLWVMMIILLIFFKASLTLFILGRLICIAIMTAVLLQMSRQFITLRWNFSIKGAILLLKDSWPLALSGFAASIYQRIDQVMLFSMIGETELGYYAVAVNVAEFLNVVPVALMTSMFPLMAERTSHDKEFTRISKLAFKYLLIPFLPVFALISLSAMEIIRIFYGDQFLPAAPALSILIWANIAVFFGVIMRQILLCKNLQWFHGINTVIGAIINVILNYSLIPKYGIHGAAIATLISYGIAEAFLSLLIPATRAYGQVGIQVVGLPITTVLVFTGVVSSLSVGLWWKVLILGFPYVLILMYLDVFQRSDLQLLQKP